MLDDNYWKLIFGASLAVLGYQVYQDYSEKRRTSEKPKKAFKICLTGGP